MKSILAVLSVAIVTALLSLCLVGTALGTEPERSPVNQVSVSQQAQDSYSNVTVHNGALTLTDNSKMVIEDCQFNQTGGVTLEDNAELIIRNAVYFSTWNSSLNSSTPFPSPHEQIVLKDHAKLTIVNSTLRFTSTPTLYDFALFDEIVCYNQSEANITESTIPYFNPYAGFVPPDDVWYWGNYLFAYDNSTVMLNEVSLSISQANAAGAQSGVHLENQAHAQIWNSTVESFEINDITTRPVVNSRCNVEIVNSSLSTLTTWYDESDLQISNSNIAYADINGPGTEIHLTNTVVDEVNAWDNDGNVWLENSTLKEIGLPHDKIWVIWSFPLIGKVSVPYNSALVLFTIIDAARANATVVIESQVLILLLVLMLIRKRDRTKRAGQS